MAYDWEIDGFDSSWLDGLNTEEEWSKCPYGNLMMGFLIEAWVRWDDHPSAVRVIRAARKCVAAANNHNGINNETSTYLLGLVDGYLCGEIDFKEFKTQQIDKVVRVMHDHFLHKVSGQADHISEAMLRKANNYMIVAANIVADMVLATHDVPAKVNLNPCMFAGAASCFAFSSKKFLNFCVDNESGFVVSCEEDIDRVVRSIPGFTSGLKENSEQIRKKFAACVLEEIPNLA